MLECEKTRNELDLRFFMAENMAMFFWDVTPCTNHSKEHIVSSFVPDVCLS